MLGSLIKVSEFIRLQAGSDHYFRETREMATLCSPSSELAGLGRLLTRIGISGQEYRMTTIFVQQENGAPLHLASWWPRLVKKKGKKMPSAQPDPDSRAN